MGSNVYDVVRDFIHQKHKVKILFFLLQIKKKYLLYLKGFNMRKIVF